MISSRTNFDAIKTLAYKIFIRTAADGMNPANEKLFHEDWDDLAEYCFTAAAKFMGRSLEEEILWTEARIDNANDN